MPPYSGGISLEMLYLIGGAVTSLASCSEGTVQLKSY
jgi:hypothetical protein